MELTRAYAAKKDGEYQIINFLSVGGAHQVMLEVRVSEMSRVLAKRLGINFSYLSRNGRSFGVSRIGSLTTAAISEINPVDIATTMSNPINIIFRFMRNGQTWTGFIDALKENGVLTVLAEPTLITYSGKTASFLVGGEFPVPVPQSGGAGGGTTTITIEWKRFGVGLNFTPTVLNNERINMLIEPEVSELDFASGVIIQGMSIPALSVTRVSTTVELGDGQSFAIAGLLKDNISQTVNEHPMLGQVPILGNLFRSNQFLKNETELIIVVTPHLVKPIDMTKQTLPIDQYVEPNDLEFYFLGKLEGFSSPIIRGSRGSASLPLVKDKEGGLEGNFGHIKP
jgi:pilus assembly protein CpaC